MTETNLNPHRRQPWTAVMLSLIMPGLGHVYCGKIVEGIILITFSNFSIPTLILHTDTSIRPVNCAWVIPLFLFLTLFISIISVIDAYRTAKRTTVYEPKEYNRWYVYILLILMSSGGTAGYALHLREKYIEAFVIPTDSMFPTILRGERVLADKMAYQWRNPQRGDIILFPNPNNRRQNYIKRVVAIGGDYIAIKNGVIYINDRELELQSAGTRVLQTDQGEVEGEVLIEKADKKSYKIFVTGQFRAQDFARTVVPRGYCFVLGDNRAQSQDSRTFGPIPLVGIKGKFEYLYWPVKEWSRIGRLDHN